MQVFGFLQNKCKKEVVSKEEYDAYKIDNQENLEDLGSGVVIAQRGADECKIRIDETIKSVNDCNTQIDSLKNTKMNKIKKVNFAIPEKELGYMQSIFVGYPTGYTFYNSIVINAYATYSASISPIPYVNMFKTNMKADVDGSGQAGTGTITLMLVNDMV